jgi:phospholipid transport system substrate-binding protein
MARLNALFACAALVAGSTQAELAAPPPPRPDVLMRSLTAEVTEILRSDLAAGRRTAVAALVEAKIVPVFDFTRMTRIAVARNWRLASPEQQERLVAQFKTLLVRTYSHALSLSDYQGQEIEYKPPREPRGDSEVIVRSTVRRSGAPPLSIDYAMADDAVAGWRVYDIQVEGVSLMLNYRESFAGIVSASGIEGLIKALAERNRSNAEGADPARLAPVLMLYSSGRRR